MESTARITEVRLHSWFPEPIPACTNPLIWSGRVRIWGRLETGASEKPKGDDNTRYWRTSSITDRLSSNRLVTYYGTHVTLLGPISAYYARRVNLSQRLISVFRYGFPFSWEQRLRRESHPFFTRRVEGPSAQATRIQPTRKSKTTLVVRKSNKPSPPTKRLMRSQSKLVQQRAKPLKTPSKTSRVLRKPVRTTRASLPSQRTKQLPKPSKAAKNPKPARSVASSSPAPSGKEEKHPTRAAKPSRPTRLRLSLDAPIYPKPSSQEMMAPIAITPKLKRTLPLQSTKSKPEIAPQHLPSNITVRSRGNQAPVPPLNLEEEIGVEIPGAGIWTTSQRDAFELQCSIVGANDRKYFEKIAMGVQGKSASDCRALLEATWASPTKKTKPLQPSSQPVKQAASNKRRLTTGGTSKKRASTGPVITKETPLKRKPFYSIDNTFGADLATPVSKPSNGGATPEIVMHVRKASKTKRGRDTAKYRRNVRHLAEVVARDTSDEVIEPTIVTPDAATGLMSRLRQVGPSQHDQFLSEMGDGTPGTEVRLKRAEAELSGQVATPEILARGKSIGFSAMDNFVAAFKRRTGAAAPAAPSFSQPQAEPQLRIPTQPKLSRRRVSFASVRFNDEDKADEDSDDDMDRDNNSEDDDLNLAI